MDGPTLAARVAAASGGDGLEGWSAGLKCVFNSLENLPPDDPTALILHSAVVCHLEPNLHGNSLFLFLARLFLMKIC